MGRRALCRSHPRQSRRRGLLHLGEQGPMACAVCRKSIGERETFTLLPNGVTYHAECFDRYLRSQEQDRAGEPPPAK
jgi:hypothetical protein